MNKPRFTVEEIAARIKEAKKIVIEHDQLDSVEMAMKKRILAGHSAEAAEFTLFYAPSGAGKSTAVRQAQTRLEQEPCCAGSPLPILYCRLPARCYIGTMTTRILTALGDPLAGRHGGPAQDTPRIINLAKAKDVRLIVIDEFQHLVSASNVRVHKEATDWLKDLLDGAGIPVIAVGLDESKIIVTSYTQLKRRTSRMTRIRPFQWDNGNETERFQSFLHLYEKALHLPNPANLGQRALAERIFLASTGLVGIATQLIREALDVSMSRASGPDCPILADFEEAYDGLPFAPGINPFDDRQDIMDVRIQMPKTLDESVVAAACRTDDERADDGEVVTHPNAGRRSRKAAA